METPSSPRTLIDPLIEILQQSHRFPASRSSALSPRQVLAFCARGLACCPALKAPVNMMEMLKVTQPHSAYSDVRAHHQEGVRSFDHGVSFRAHFMQHSFDAGTYPSAAPANDTLSVHTCTCRLRPAGLSSPSHRHIHGCSTTQRIGTQHSECMHTWAHARRLARAHTNLMRAHAHTRTHTHSRPHGPLSGQSSTNGVGKALAHADPRLLS